MNCASLRPEAPAWVGESVGAGGHGITVTQPPIEGAVMGTVQA
jgi:hypothetical protein